MMKARTTAGHHAGGRPSSSTVWQCDSVDHPSSPRVPPSSPRSVVFRPEIGPLPARDRSHSASRSVQCGVSGHLRQGEWVSASSVVVPGRVVLGAGVRVSRAGRSWGGSTGACVCPGVLGVAHSRMLRAGGNRGIMRNRNVGSGQNPAPMCADPSHRTWEPDRYTRRSPEKPVNPTRTSPAPQRLQSPMCNTDDNHAHQALSQMPRHTTILSRNSTDFGAEADRSRCGVRPISARNRTDLGGLSRVAIGRRRF